MIRVFVSVIVAELVAHALEFDGARTLSRRNLDTTKGQWMGAGPQIHGSCSANKVPFLGLFSVQPRHQCGAAGRVTVGSLLH